MSFERAWALALLILPVAWVIWAWRRQIRHAPLILKAAMACAVVLALAEPVLQIEDRKVALAALVDTSASITPADLDREGALVREMRSAKGSNRLEVFPFARRPRALSPEEAAALHFQRTAGAEGRGTNLESPIREALASLPAGMIHRIVLLSDGNENDGAATRAAWQAEQLGVHIDAIALNGRAQPQLQTEAVGLPGTVFTGEHFPVDLTIYSPKATQATVELAAEGKQIGSHQIALEQGENRIRIRTSLSAAGAIDLSGRIEAPGMGESRFENAVAVRRPKVVWVSEDPAGTEEHIVGVLAANKFDVVQTKSLPDKLDDAQLVVFNNDNLEAMKAADKQRVEDYVQRGGGALWIAGEHNIYVDHKDAPEDPLSRTFPAKLAPPRSPEGTAVILIIDKSSSMEGKKIELARLAAVGVVDNLRPDDYVGVLIFDNSFQWAVPIRKAEDKALIKRLISGITPDGGTQIAPALNEAYRRIVGLNSTYKHIVLLTDGISEEGDSLTLSKEAANNRVTISTVGLGQDVNRQYLEHIAQNAKGKSYFLNEPTGLEQILLKDVKEHTGTTAVEKPIKALVKHPSDLLDKVDVATAPNLLGYIRFDARPTADEVLEVDEKDPLLIRWQYGLGRAAVFASDAKSRWAASWVGWNGFDRLWTNIFRDLLPHGNESEAVARYDAANEELVVEYHLAAEAQEPATPPDLFVIGPGDFRRPLDLSRISPGVYRGRVRIGSLEGLFRVRPLNETRAFPEVGLYRQEAELSDYGSNDVLLKSIAQSTGGRFNPSVRQLFDNGGRSIESTMRLWPGLLALAIILNLIELAMRKWGGVIDSFRGHREQPVRLAAD
ncbi:MAG TPA: VWA domain-containing protein [Bryobacteraceae bacterium]|nr:VWA domain-containing protein [Bryobacteraceae bacterium]